MGVSVDTIPSAIQVTEIQSLADLQQLEAEWFDLWHRCPSATPFQSPQWLLPWCELLCPGALSVYALRQDGRLVGLAPFYLRARQLQLCGTGITDYLDVLLDPACEDLAAAALLFQMAGNSERWDLCECQQLRSDSALLRLAAFPDWTDEITVQEVCPVLALPRGSTSPLSGAIPRRMLEKTAYYRRRLASVAQVKFEQATTLDEFTKLFGTFLELHRARWSSRGQSGVLADPAVEAFHWQAAPRLLLSGNLRLYGLRINDRIAAALYGFGDANCTYFYLSGFDPEFAQFSPGTLLVAHAIEEAEKLGASCFDFLRGREAYKYLWGAKARLNYRRRFWHQQPPAKRNAPYRSENRQPSTAIS